MGYTVAPVIRSFRSAPAHVMTIARTQFATSPPVMTSLFTPFLLPSPCCKLDWKLFASALRAASLAHFQVVSLTLTPFQLPSPSYKLACKLFASALTAASLDHFQVASLTLTPFLLPSPCYKLA